MSESQLKTVMVPRPVAPPAVPKSSPQEVARARDQVPASAADDSSLWLTRLRPPPLPLWAVPHASAALSLSRMSLLAAQAASNTGFKVARLGTTAGFKVARTMLGPVLSGAGAVLDHALGTEGIVKGSNNIGSGAFANVPQLAIDGFEALALYGIDIGAGVTNVVLGSATSTVALLESVYGNDEALRCLQAFLKLVKAEWNTSLPTDPFSEGGLGHWSLPQITKAAATWAALTSLPVTIQHDGQRLADSLEELDLEGWGRDGVEGDSGEVIWEITDEQTLEDGGEVIEARIDQRKGSAQDDALGSTATDAQTTREHLKRFSKMCLGSYGGMGVLFFGVKLPLAQCNASRPLTAVELAKLSDEQHAASSASVSHYATPRTSPTPLQPAEQAAALERQLGDLQLDVDLQKMDLMSESGDDDSEIAESEPSGDLAAEMGFRPSAKAQSGQDGMGVQFWKLVTGEHDNTLLTTVGGLDPESSTLHQPDVEESSDDDSADEDYTAVSYMDRKALRAKQREERARRQLKGRRPPRFYVVTDYPNRSVLLVLRGTSSIDDIATDLACESCSFEHTAYWGESASGVQSGSTAVNADAQDQSQSPSKHEYRVHSGMMEMAETLGGKDGPVTRAVARALVKNPDFGLFIVGHSLGAGVATLLGLRWANPQSGKTSSKSGLPEGRTVRVYAFAPPCVTDSGLSLKAKKLVHSVVYSADAVTRFSLGHMRDIRSAAAWLCFANDANPEDASNNILSRIIAYKAGRLDADPQGKREAEQFFVAARTALEEKQGYAELFPAGDILWMTKKGDVALPSDTAEQRDMPVRLFKVTGRPEVVFKQILFSKNMLSSHLPHQYASAIADYL